MFTVRKITFQAIYFREVSDQESGSAPGESNMKNDIPLPRLLRVNISARTADYIGKLSKSAESQGLSPRIVGAISRVRAHVDAYTDPNRGFVKIGISQLQNTNLSINSTDVKDSSREVVGTQPHEASQYNSQEYLNAQQDLQLKAQAVAEIAEKKALRKQDLKQKTIHAEIAKQEQAAITSEMSQTISSKRQKQIQEIVQTGGSAEETSKKIQSIRGDIVMPYLSDPNNQTMILDFIKSNKNLLSNMILDESCVNSIESENPDIPLLLKNSVFLQVLISQQYPTIESLLSESDRNDFQIISKIHENADVSVMKEYSVEHASMDLDEIEEQENEIMMDYLVSAERVYELSQSEEQETGVHVRTLNIGEKDSPSSDSEINIGDLLPGQTEDISQKTPSGNIEYTISCIQNDTYVVDFDGNSFELHGDRWEDDLEIIMSLRATPILASIFTRGTVIFDTLKKNFGILYHGKGIHSSELFTKFVYDTLIAAAGMQGDDLIHLSGLPAEMAGQKILKMLQDPLVAKEFSQALQRKNIINQNGELLSSFERAHKEMS